MPAFYDALKKAALPGIWNKGLTLQRGNCVHIDLKSDEEIQAHVVDPARPAAARVEIWPCNDPEAEAEDHDWHCNCGDRAQPCAHIVAVALAIKTGSATATAESDNGTAPAATLLHYLFVIESNNTLRLERTLQTPKGTLPFDAQLTAIAGGLQSGRIAGPPLVATQEEFRVDQLLQKPLTNFTGMPIKGGLDTKLMATVLDLLKDHPRVSVGSDKVVVGPKIHAFSVRVERERGGVKLTRVPSPGIIKTFVNGAALWRSPQGQLTLRALQSPELSPQELSWLDAYFQADALPRVLSEVLPAIRSKVHVEEPELPQARKARARVQIEVLLEGSQSAEPVFKVIPQWLKDNAGKGEVLIPDSGAEQALALKLRNELHASPGQISEFSWQEGAEFIRKAKQLAADGEEIEITDKLGAEKLVQPRALLEPGLTFSHGQLGPRMELVFKNTKAASPTKNTELLARALHAHQQGQSSLWLEGLGAIKLPHDWLDRHGQKVLSLLKAQNASPSQTLPMHEIPQLSKLAQSHFVQSPAEWTFTEAEDQSPLPAISAKLRGYQEQGVRWLRGLLRFNLGALLADDMGLGKTLQAICCIPKGKPTLIVAPTSVLVAWSEQLERFRPELSVTLYHGPDRRWPAESQFADIVLTSYALLRSDTAITQKHWELAILDEAQNIRNPESQVALAAFKLNSQKRIALTGTPVENRLRDLWSIFSFLNPGLLTGEEPDAVALERVRPFMLRRSKDFVAPELPPRTEMHLEAELSTNERALYDSLLASAQKDIRAALEEKGLEALNTFSLLELLLRLRQACCHAALVPGSAVPPEQASSKVALLVETLQDAIEGGHRSLVFSQWTSLLDLIELQLNQSAIPFLRLDGSTRDRSAVINAFQASDGPPVLLLSLKAGGVGLNLTAADHVCILDPWWNPAVEQQAADRAHRIGQSKPVTIRRFVAKDTIEENVLKLQAHKRELAERALNSSTNQVDVAELSREEILKLLGSNS